MTKYIYTATWVKGMNTRPQPSTTNAPNGTVPYNTPTDCVEVWEATYDGLAVRKGDKWARLDSPVVQWVAVVHLGVTYGTIRTVEESPTEPVGEFPEWFDLTNPQGETKRYVITG